MKTWYFAKCDNCREFKDIFCNNPSVTEAYLSPYNEDIQMWLTKHYGCELVLGWRDDQLDFVHENGYTRSVNRL